MACYYNDTTYFILPYSMGTWDLMGYLEYSINVSYTFSYEFSWEFEIGKSTYHTWQNLKWDNIVQQEAIRQYFTYLPIVSFSYACRLIFTNWISSFTNILPLQNFSMYSTYLLISCNYTVHLVIVVGLIFRGLGSSDSFVGLYFRSICTCSNCLVIARIQ